MQKWTALLPEKLNRLGPMHDFLVASGKKMVCSNHALVFCSCRQAVLRIKKSLPVGVFLKAIIGPFVFYSDGQGGELKQPL